MKAAFCAAFLSLGFCVASAAENAFTAYSALRVVGKRSGADALNHVLEVRGRFGTPAPDVWKVTLSDPDARGGLRELEVQSGKVVSEKTPTSHDVSGKINFNQLNLDSEGVFTVCNQEMQKAKVTFDRADYLLKSGSGSGSPVWYVDLYSGRNGRVAAFEVAADNGNILSRNLDRQAKAATPAPVPPVPRIVSRPPPRPVPPEDDYRTAPADDYRRAPVEDYRRAPRDDYAQRPVARDDYRSDDYRREDDYRRDDYRRDEYRRDDSRRVYEEDEDYRVESTPFVDRVGHHFLKRGRQFKNFFTGRGWTDQQ